MGDLLGKSTHCIGKFVALRSRNPFEPQPFGRDADESEQVFHHRHSLGCHVVAFSVMATPDVTAGHKDTVCPLLEGFKNEVRGDATAAHYPDGKDIGGILEPCRTGEISPRVTSPMATESDYDRLKGTLHLPSKPQLPIVTKGAALVL